MDGLSGYIMQIISAGILCHLCQQVGNATKSAALVRFVGSLALLCAVLSPVISSDFSGMLLPVKDCFNIAEEASLQGKNEAEKAISAIIKQQTEAYILDKAAQLGADLEVSVELSLDSIPKPFTVQISGNISPYAKYTLSAMIQRDLDIAKEQQKWIN